MPIEEGTLDPLLWRLESQGLLSREWQTASGSPRRDYTLTGDGRRLIASLECG